MKFITSLALTLLVFVSGCASLQVGSDVAAGRRAMLTGNNEAALAYFHKAALADPSYHYGTAYRQGIYSYVGRSEYAVGQYPQARETLQKALTANREEDLARLYLGLTLARSGDRQQGLREIESGMKGIYAWINYVNEAHRYSFGRFWDPARTIRSSIEEDLAIMTARDVDVQQIVARVERIGRLMEEEGDNARRDESRELNRETNGNTEP